MGILKEEIMKEFLEHFRSSIPWGAVVPLLGMLLMVLFSIERFSLYLRQLVKLN
jgi:hypothetical protein